MKKWSLLFPFVLFICIIIKCNHTFLILKNKKVTDGYVSNLIGNIKRNVLYAKKKKKNRRVVVIECTEARKLGKPPTRYVTEKNRVNTPKKLQLYKYNKYLKRRTLHVEIK